MEIAIGIMAHGGAARLVARHMPYWRKTSENITLFWPETDPSEYPGVNNVVYGIGGDPNVNKDRLILRWKNAWKYMYARQHPWYLFLEFDALVLGPVPEYIFDNPALHANIYGIAEDSPILPGKRWFAFPHLMPHSVLAQLNSYDHPANGLYMDEYLDAIVKKLHIPISPFGYLGFSAPTIEGFIIEQAKKGRLAGAIFWHGIKTEEVLNMLTK